MAKYKGFSCVNISDCAFPIYGIFAPDGKQIDSTLFPSEMKQIVNNYLK